MLKLQFEVLGTVEFSRGFNRVARRLEDLRPLWDVAERDLQRFGKEQFASEGAAGRGGKWKPLTPAYAKQKAITHPGKPILRKSDRMMRALTGETSDTLIVKDPLEFGFGTRLLYPKFHQRGTRKMAARPPVNLSESQRTRLTKDLQKELLTKFRGDLDGAAQVVG